MNPISLTWCIGLHDASLCISVFISTVETATTNEHEVCKFAFRKCIVQISV